LSNRSAAPCAATVCERIALARRLQIHSGKKGGTP
jgi:hypothetical protein